MSVGLIHEDVLLEITFQNVSNFVDKNWSDKILFYQIDPNKDNTCIFFNISLINENGAAFQILDNKFYISSDHSSDEEIGYTNKYDEMYSDVNLFLSRLSEVLDNGVSTRGKNESSI